MLHVLHRCYTFCPGVTRLSEKSFILFIQYLSRLRRSLRDLNIVPWNSWGRLVASPWSYTWTVLLSANQNRVIFSCVRIVNSVSCDLIVQIPGWKYVYRIYSNKRRGAYLIFRATSAAGIRGRRIYFFRSPSWLFLYFYSTVHFLPVNSPLDWY